MKKNKILLLSLFMLLTLFLNIKSAQAETRGEVFCRYSFSGDNKSGNAVEALGKTLTSWVSNVTGWVGDLVDVNLNFYEKNGLKHGKLRNITVDIVDDNGTIKVTETRSSALFVRFTSYLTSERFYDANGHFSCPSELVATKEGYTSDDYLKMNLADEGSSWYDITSWGEYYVFKRIMGPEYRTVSEDNLDIRNVSCVGILGPFKKDLDGLLKMIRMLAPIFVVCLCTYDFLYAIFSKDAEKLKQAYTRLWKRLVLFAVLFFLPLILNIVLNIIDVSYSTCVY